MTDAKPAGLPAKESTRPAHGSWAPGDYMCQCVGCRSIFIGDKRALHCADCAYALPDTKAALDTERAARFGAEARVKVLEGAIDNFIDATRQECCGRGVGYGSEPECCGQPDLLVNSQALDDLCNSRAALKEPANG